MSARIVYIGAERVGLACLERLHDMGMNVVGVVTADDSLKDRIADWVAFDDFCERTGLPLYKVQSTRQREAIELVRSLGPELVCVISWSMIIPPEILEIPAKGIVGFHYSMLPARRGGAPLNWAIIDGLTDTGITLMYLDEGIDTGDIIAQRPLQIAQEDTVKDLLDRIVFTAPNMLAENIDDIEAGAVVRIKQDESQATLTRRRRPEDGEIDWSKPPAEIYNFIRALAPPYPCAFTTIRDHKIVIPSAHMKDGRLYFEGYLK